MALLNVHLNDPGDHGHLGFHPECLICRQQRLVRSFSSERVLARRARAVLASGVLALSAAAPAVALAGDPDRQQEGVVAPSQPDVEAPGGTDGVAEDPGFDPGGDTTLPVEAPLPGATEETAAPEDAYGDGDDDADGEDNATEDQSADDVVLEQEPLEDPGVLLVPGDEAEPTAPPTADGSPAEVPTAPSVDVPPAAPAPPAAIHDACDSSAAQRVAAPKHLSFGARPASAAQPSGIAPARETSPSGGSPVPSASNDSLGTQDSVLLADAGQDAQPAVPESGESLTEQGALLRSGRIHVVKPGESLWSIATDLLGARASAARIALEVGRLWKLNKNQIGTGDPDVLPVGAELRLR